MLSHLFQSSQIIFRPSSTKRSYSIEDTDYMQPHTVWRTLNDIEALRPSCFPPCQVNTKDRIRLFVYETVTAVDILSNLGLVCLSFFSLWLIKNPCCKAYDTMLSIADGDDNPSTEDVIALFTYQMQLFCYILIDASLLNQLCKWRAETNLHFLTELISPSFVGISLSILVRKELPMIFLTDNVIGDPHSFPQLLFLLFCSSKHCFFNLYAVFLSQVLDSFREVHPFVFHDEIHGTTTFSTGKAFAYIPSRRNSKRWSSVFMKRAYTLKIGTSSF